MDNTVPAERIREESEAMRRRLVEVRAEISKAIVGHAEVIEQVLVCLLCRGHALVEGVPGLGKTCFYFGSSV